MGPQQGGCSKQARAAPCMVSVQERGAKATVEGTQVPVPFWQTHGEMLFWGPNGLPTLVCSPVHTSPRKSI